MATKRPSKRPLPPSSVVQDLRTRLHERERDVQALSTANAELGTALAALRVSEERYRLELEETKRELEALRGQGPRAPTHDVGPR